ncbi:MAG: glycosyltransferase family 4 protein [Planctomycetota bacterium]
MTTPPRPIYLDHTAKLGGAELCLADLAPHRPGAGVLLFEDGPLTEQLRRRGLEVQTHGDAKLSAVRRDAGWRQVLRGAWGAVGLARWVARRSRDADLLYANSLKAMFVAAAAGRLTGRPVLWHLHDILSPEHFSRLNRRLCVAVANAGVSRVVANSYATAAAYRDAGGRAPVEVVYNGIDPAPIVAAAPATDPAPAGDTAPIVGIFGRLSPWKGQHVLIDAAARLRDRGRSVGVWVIGDALFGERDYVLELERQIDRLGLRDRVRMLGFRADVAALMKRCDIVVSCSTSPEPFGRVIAEAMFVGVPVVATAAGGAAELVRNGETGRSIPPDDPAALADAIADHLADPRAGRRMAIQALGFAENQLSLTAILPQWYQALSDSVPSRDAAQRRLAKRRNAVRTRPEMS